MNERTQPGGEPESPDQPAAAGPPPGPIGWPERPADAAGAAEPPPATPASSPPAAAPPPPPPAQPAVQWQAPAAAAVVVGKQRRTTLSAIAGVLLLVLGIIGLLFGVLFLASGAFVGQLIGGFGDQIPGMPEGLTAEQFFAGMFAFIGVIVIGYSLLYVMGGIGVLRSSDFGRILGIIVAVLSGLIWAGGLTGGGQADGAEGGIVVALVLFLVHLYVFFVLVFKWRQAARPMPPG